MQGDNYWLLPVGTNPVAPDGLPAFIPGPARYSPVAAIRREIDRLLQQLEPELEPFRDSRPECRSLRFSGPWLGPPPASAPPPDCQRNHPACIEWAASVRRWHHARFGIGHDDVTFARLAKPAATYRYREIRPLEAPNLTVVASRVDGARPDDVYSLHVDASATMDSFMATAKRLGTVLQSAGLIARNNGRSNRLDRPARAAYWLVRKVEGWSGSAIAREWETSTSRWAGDPDGDPEVPAKAPDPGDLIYPAFLEWSSVRDRTPDRSPMERIERPSIQVVYDAIRRFRRFAGQ